jgi:hypothetical protein
VNDAEFRVLRQTIAARGTARILLVPLTLTAWAALTLTLVLFSNLPIAALLPLGVLAAGFEAIHALHVGVERIGRYLQVFYEEQGNGARWEWAAMQTGTPLPGGGVDPLFTALFLSALVVNLVPALLPSPTSVELGAVGMVHAAFAVRVMRARIAARRQRATELEQYRQLFLREGNRQ